MAGILLVEDNAEFASAACRELETAGHTVFGAAGSLDALEVLDQHQNVIGLVVIDIVLQDNEPNGIALARAVRRKNPEMPVILMTAYPDEIKKKVRTPGLVLLKPFELSMLTKAVDVCLGSQSR